MTVLDAYAVLALLRDEPAAPGVARLLGGGQPASLTPLGVAEVVDQLVRAHGADPDTAVLDVAQLGLDEPVPLDHRTALRGRAARARRYRRRCEISVADCVAAETARARGEPLATADPDLLDACSAEGIEVVVLPDSTGREWPGSS